MTKRAYCRCNSGHYFIGEHCPFDGWSSAASRELTEAVKKLETQKRDISIVELRAAGVSDTTLWCTLVIEFATSASAFEALSPDHLVIDGESKPLHKLSLAFK